MLECHILQAQAQALSADEKEANRIACDLRDYPELSIPPGPYMQSIEEASTMRTNNNIIQGWIQQF